MVAISGAADNPKTTLAPNNKDAPTKTAPAKEIATAKSVDGKEDETKNVKKGDLGKDSKKNESSEESPSEDAQEDLGVDENRGPTIPAYQIPEQPKDVKRKKRWDNSIGYAIDNALGAIFGRPPPPPPADTVIEEITYVDEYPPGPVVYKRSKGLPPPSKSEADNNDTKLNPTKELAGTPIDSVDTVSLKGEPIAITKPEIEAKAPIVSIKNTEQKAMPKMEVGNEVTILPAIDEEKDFGSSAENVEEMKYQRIAPEVAGLIKKSVPLSENSNSTEEASEGKSLEDAEAPEAKSAEEVPESDGKEDVQENQMKDKSDANEKKDDKNGEKEFVPVYPEDDKESEDEEAAEKPQKDDPKALKMGKTEKSESQKGESVVAEASEEKDSGGEEYSNKSQDDKTQKESQDEASKTDNEKDNVEEKDKKPTAEKPRHREPEKLPVNPKTSDEKDEDKAAEELPLVDHEPKKLPEEEKDDASEKSEEDEIEDKVEKNNDDEGANIEKDEYAPADGKVEEDKVKIDAINPVSPEIKEHKEAKKPVKVQKDDDKLGPAPYPSEISDDDFSIDHKTGLMPAVSSSSNDNDNSDSNIPEASENEKGDDYNVLQKLQDDVDAAAKKDQSPDYIVMEELKDPIQGHRKFTILKPTYRAFHPTDNKLIEKVKATLDKSKIEKRSIKSAEENESEEESFKSSFSKDTVIESDSNEILKNVADAIERDGLRKPKKDQQPMFIPDDYPIPLKKIEKPTLNEILGIPESAGPIMIEPEGGIPKGLKQVQSDSDESEFNNPDYDAPQKVVIESKQKITLVYDDSSEEATKDSSSESSEEEQQQWIPIMDIATIINDQTLQKSKPIITKVEDPEQQPPTALPMKHSEAYEEQLKKYSNILGNNLVITLSISPPILIIAGVICLTLLLFKVYWILYSPPLKGSIIPQHSSSSSSAAATTPNMDFRTPLSIVTVNDNPKKLPL
uniref:Uncharacterized protein n=1 Tax=Panagrolaimus davidi TaxID=227884 RepID=A0A914QAF9_9BILA